MKRWHVNVWNYKSDISQAQTTATSPPSGEVGCQLATPPLEAILPDFTKKETCRNT